MVCDATRTRLTTGSLLLTTSNLHERFSHNSSQAIWNAFWEAVNARSDLRAVLSVMQLQGFGASVDQNTGQRRAKVATAVLRFLLPEEWGVVDWRTTSMLAELEKCNWDIDQAIMGARSRKPKNLRSKHEIMNEAMVCEVNRKYRAKRTAPPLARAADVDMAIFGLSVVAWPL